MRHPGRDVPHPARAGATRHRRADRDVLGLPGVTRAAIVGTGYVARVHAHALRGLGVPVVAVCGRSTTEAFARETGARACDDLVALLDAEHPDVLHVCTPNALHATQALLALERGVHVVCEKPLAVSVAESAALVEAADGLVGATCYHARGYP